MNLCLSLHFASFVCDYVCTGPVEITSAELSHAGRYSCTAKNAAGSTHRHVQLTVQGKNIPRCILVHFVLLLLMDSA